MKVFIFILIWLVLLLTPLKAQHEPDFFERCKIAAAMNFAHIFFNDVVVNKKNVFKSVRDAAIGATFITLPEQAAYSLIEKKPGAAIFSQSLLSKSRQLRSHAMRGKSFFEKDVLTKQVLYSWDMSYLFFNVKLGKNPKVKFSPGSMFSVFGFAFQNMLSHAPAKNKPGFSDIDLKMSLISGVVVLGNPYSARPLITGSKLVVGRKF